MALKRNDRLKWNSRSILEGNGQIGDLRQEIPQFAEAPFSVEDRGENKYLRLIVREPLKEGQGFLFPSNNQEELQIPVATVLETVQASSTSSYSNVIRNGAEKSWSEPRTS